MIHRHTRLAIALSLFVFFYDYSGPQPDVVAITFLVTMALWVLSTFLVYKPDGSEK